MSPLALIPVALILVALVVFLVMRNIKDKKQLEDQLNNDYRKPHKDKEDPEPEEPVH